MNHNSSVLLPIPRHVDIETQLSFSREGHAVLRSFLPPSFLLSLRTELQTIVHQEILAAWQQKVAVATNSLSEETCPTIEQCQKKLISLGLPTDIPFLQFFNTWRKLSSVEAICKSPLLASAASQLMGIPRVRLYQDSLFVKRWKDGKTPWHIDARMSPFDTQHFLTFWIPLQPIHSNGGTALLFVNKTHSDIALPYWNELDGKEYQRLDHRYSSTAIHHYMPLALGDVTVHSGWTLHCADANISNNNKKKQSTSEDRYALAVTYVDARAEIREDVVESVARFKQKSNNNKNKKNSKGDNEDTSSFLPWIQDVKPRTQFNHHLVPLVWPTTQD
eukprot:CAMPEP_0172433070 /NCGR_PEP_ID=MMETSP1064-20121228/66404_1 /TAXON_ID=202472 /ORGANISM="Aulacoseira subarctica , Strain CCAP 1002/5" /LENGTH=332 /DNA_ID=CAMNT_0013180787 /DNA_START=226 /DNA_END=1224 /DNA_ORIENTATION=-